MALAGGVFDIELHDPDAANNRDDSDDDAIEIEEADYDEDPNINVIPIDSDDHETVHLSEHVVNKHKEKTGPQDFELRKVLGKGGYGKTFHPYYDVASSVESLRLASEGWSQYLCTRHGQPYNSAFSQMAELCLKSTYFSFDRHFYEQTEGAPMGLPLSPVVANLYMEAFERTALDTASLKPKKWLLYVDDVWAIWPHGEDTLRQFLDHLNGMHPNIRFTIEIEKNRELHFLDVLTTRMPHHSMGETSGNSKL